MYYNKLIKVDNNGIFIVSTFKIFSNKIFKKKKKKKNKKK